MTILVSVLSYDLHGAVSRAAVNDNVFDIGTVLIDHVLYAELYETDAVENGRYDG
jgi:hypothetical protein